MCTQMRVKFPLLSSWRKRNRSFSAIAAALLGLLLLFSLPPRPAQSWPGDMVQVWSSPTPEDGLAIAWVDYDNDGDADLAIGMVSQPTVRIYRNDRLTMTPVWSSTDSYFAVSVAWGDMDADGDLDLAAGNSGANQLYHNDGGVLTLDWTAPVSENTWSVAWGDYDHDGDLDLAVGNNGAPVRIYNNAAGVLTSAWTGPTESTINDLSWGDYDADGDLDLLTGGGKVYCYDGGGVFTYVWAVTAGLDGPPSWGDWDFSLIFSP